jgi:hypothetical protein
MIRKIYYWLILILTIVLYDSLYGCGTCLSLQKENILRVFEKRLLRGICEYMKKGHEGAEIA